MNLTFKRSFAKDLKRLRNAKVRQQVEAAITQIEQAEDLSELHDIKRLQADGPYYRLRIDDYRLGLVIDDTSVILVRCLHRKDIYRYFP